MEEKLEWTEKKRPWFRFHFSTSIVMMVIAGALLYENAAESGKVALEIEVGRTKCREDGPGWPLPLYVETYNKWAGPKGLEFTPRSRQYDSMAFPINAAVCAALLLSVSFAFDYLIRRCFEK